MTDPFFIGPHRDELVAQALRVQLDTGADDDALLARIRLALQAVRPSAAEILASWLKPGLAAAAVVVLATWLWSTYQPVPQNLEAALAPNAGTLLEAAVGAEGR